MKTKQRNRRTRRNRKTRKRGGAQQANAQQASKHNNPPRTIIQRRRNDEELKKIAYAERIKAEELKKIAYAERIKAEEDKARDERMATAENTQEPVTDAYLESLIHNNDPNEFTIRNRSVPIPKRIQEDLLPVDVPDTTLPSWIEDNDHKILWRRMVELNQEYDDLYNGNLRFTDVTLDKMNSIIFEYKQRSLNNKNSKSFNNRNKPNSNSIIVQSVNSFLSKSVMSRNRWYSFKPISVKLADIFNNYTNPLNEYVKRMDRNLKIRADIFRQARIVYPTTDAKVDGRYAENQKGGVIVQIMHNDFDDDTKYLKGCITQLVRNFDDYKLFVERYQTIMNKILKFLKNTIF